MSDNHQVSDRESCEIVYLLGDGRAFKIGHSTTTAFRSRLSSIQVGNPEDVVVVCVARVPDGRRAEVFLHAKYRQQSRRGEWFTFSEEQIEDVKETFAQLGKIIPTPEPEEEKYLSQEEISVLWRDAAGYLIEQCEINGYNPRWVMKRLEALSASLSAWERYSEWRGYKPGWAEIQYANQEGTLPPPRCKDSIRGVSSTRVVRERQMERRAAKIANKKIIETNENGKPTVRRKNEAL